MNDSPGDDEIVVPLVPRDESFFDLFEQQAGHVAAARRLILPRG